MTARSLTIVLHGAVEPEAAVLAALRTRVVASLGSPDGDDIEVAAAFERAGAARGAAALVGDAVSRSRADDVVCLAVTSDGQCADAAPLLAAIRDRPCLAVADADSRSARWTQVAGAGDLVSEIAADVARVFAGERPAAWPGFVPAWAAPRRLLTRAGGLDRHLLHVGEVLDLSLRVLESGDAVESLPVRGPAADEVYPLHPGLQEFLAWKHATSLALERPALEAAGRLTAWVAAQAIARAWFRAGLDPEVLRFGGRWAERALQDRLLGRAGQRRNDTFWPRDPAGASVPFLALDAALDEFVARGATLPSRPGAADVGLGAGGRGLGALRSTADESPAIGYRPSAIGSESHFAELQQPGADVDRRGPNEAPLDSGPEHPADAGGWRSVAPQQPSPPTDAHSRDGAAAPLGPAATSAEVGTPGPADRTLPTVSVVVVNWNGREHLEPCFSSLQACDYPSDKLELICVDNGSTDGSRELLASAFPGVRVVALESNRGFTGGNIAGVAAARGDVLAFFNNDMRIAADAIRRLVASLDADHPCAAARVLNWSGDRIDFVRGTLNFEARGFQERYGERVRPELSAAGESFFANGGAFVITRAAYDAAGGFDEAFFAYYDDTDLGWGVRINGGRIRIVPEAIAYHRHSATTNKWPKGQKLYLMERNAVWTAVKRYGERTLVRTLGPTLLLAARRVAHDSGVDASTSLGRALAPFSSRVRGRAAAAPWGYDERQTRRLTTSAQATVVPRSATREGRKPARYQDEDAEEAGAFRPPAPSPQPPVREGWSDADSQRFLIRVPLESVAALGEAMRGLVRVAPQRRALQAARVVGDEQVLPAFGRALEYMTSRRSYMDTQDALVARFDLGRTFSARTRVLLITHDPLRANMSGPGVRVLELGRALAATCDVTVATPFEPDLQETRCRVAKYEFDRPTSLYTLAEQADVVVIQGFTLSRFPTLSRMPCQLVVDLYCPFTIEHLEMRTSALRHAPDSPSTMPLSQLQHEAAGILEAQNYQLGLGDFFLCASERQRDFWLGALQTAGRLNELTYRDDPSLRSLIDVVPFGLPDAPPPAKTRSAIKGVLPGVGPDDQVILWAGSLLDWQDPQGLVRAVARLATTHPRVKLVFMGTRHPNPDVPLQRAVEESMAVARDLGVLDRHVVFNTWVPYAERHEWLLEADLGVSTHHDHLETRFAYRTRMLDYLWAGLPVVCTRGDVFADLVEEERLGLTVPPDDEVALAVALGDLLDDEVLRAECTQRLKALSDRMRWSRVVGPLERFCASPRHAADRAPGQQAYRRRLEEKFRVSKWMKRTALKVGVSEARIEQFKQTGPVRRAMSWRNKVAIARAQRGK